MVQLNLRVVGLVATIACALSAAVACSSIVAEAAPKSTLFLHITNHRKVNLVELHATAVGESSGRSLLKGLEPGGSEVVKVPRMKKCIFELHATYEDGTFTDFHHFDLCMDETINLVD